MARKQEGLPGVETPEIAELEEQGEVVGDLCEKRMKLATQEREERKKLGAMMHEHKKRTYGMRDGRVIELKSATEEKVTVRRPKKRGRHKKVDA